MSTLRLHGYPVSNYFNVARAALIEKRASFEIVIVRASKDEAFLARSPMGKIPVLETDTGWIAETVAILEYLDDAIAQPSLRPANIVDRARARQIVNILQMYIEAPLRSLFPGVFMGATNDPAVVAGVRSMLDRSTAALARLLRPAPFIFGDALSAADLFAFYTFDIAERVTRFVFDRSIVDEIGTIGDWHDAMHMRASSRTVLADFEPYFARYLTDHGAAYRKPGVEIGVAAGSAHA